MRKPKFNINDNVNYTESYIQANRNTLPWARETYVITKIHTRLLFAPIYELMYEDENYNVISVGYVHEKNIRLHS